MWNKELLRLSPYPLAKTAGALPRRGLPHPASTIDQVRDLVHQTTLSYREIARRTGVSAATISRRARANGWYRPASTFPDEHYTPEGRRILRRRALAELLMRQAERHAEQLAWDPQVKPAAVLAAIRLARAAASLDRVDKPARRRRR